MQSLIKKDKSYKLEYYIQTKGGTIDFWNNVDRFKEILNSVSLKKFYIIDREIIKNNLFFILFLCSLLFNGYVIVFWPVLNIWQIVSVFVMLVCIIIPKLRILILNYSINALWIILNVFVFFNSFRFIYHCCLL